MLRYSSEERRGRLDLRIGSVLNFIQPKSVTHVGAHLAEEAWEYSYFDIPVLWIEAIPELVAQIEKNGLPRSQKVIQGLFSNKSGESQTLNLMGSDFALSSKLNVRDSSKISRKLDLITSVLDDLPSTDLLVLDVQGAELEVLQGATTFLDKCTYIFLEASLSDIYYSNTPTLQDLTKFLNSFGFRMVLRVLHGHNGLEGNCLFVKTSNVSRIELFKLINYGKFRRILLILRNSRKKIGRVIRRR